MKRVVITGVGAVTPLGNSVNEFWANCLSGVSGAGKISRFDASKFKTQFACEVKNFFPESYIEKKEVRKYDLFTQYAIKASDDAIVDSGLDFSTMSVTEKSEIGVIWASGNGGIGTFEKEMRDHFLGDGTPRFNPFFIPKMIVDIAAGIISIRNKLYGPNYCTVSACASSNTAIISAFDAIRLGKAKVIIAGGSEAPITPSAIGGFNASQALSQRNTDPEKASRPFDKKRDGFVLGEGAGAIILEDLDYAIKRGAKIYAEVAGGGMAADAFHLTSTSADGLGARLGMMKALTDAGVKSSCINYINAHATSTYVGDKSELAAIKAIFEDAPVYISATKSMTGHLLGAAGAIEGILCILSICNNKIPPTINLDEPDDDIAPNLKLVNSTGLEADVSYVMNNTFGFGGHTATTIFKKYEP